MRIDSRKPYLLLARGGTKTWLARKANDFIMHTQSIPAYFYIQSTNKGEYIYILINTKISKGEETEEVQSAIGFDFP